MTPAIQVTQLTRPHDVGHEIRAALAACWAEVSNAGGAVGFPAPPVDPIEVRAAVDALADGLDPSYCRVLTAMDGTALAGWVVINRNTRPLVAHWATVQRLQTALAYRSQGIGRLLMERVRQVARDEMHLEHLLLTIRGGMGLEKFYLDLGWIEVGRHVGALRLSPGDDRDEVFMSLQPL